MQISPGDYHEKVFYSVFLAKLKYIVMLHILAKKSFSSILIQLTVYFLGIVYWKEQGKKGERGMVVVMKEN